jgi:DNA-binding transcriptional ArsR family regulator
MAYANVTAMLTSVEQVYLRANTLFATSKDALKAEPVPAAAARRFVSEAEGLLEALRQVRLDLDSSSAQSWLVDSGDPLNALDMAILVREIRSRLSRVSQALTSLRDAALVYAEGDDYIQVMSTTEDTLQRIAQVHLGDWRHWPALLEANPDLSVDTVPPGTVVQVPIARPRVRLLQGG